ncbi:hypothetical protein C8R42DRAFT_717403 [Lentinula raphanica]|nr:hypothetical protein C8R42DRAFT_717403 [Lentinula raphanica]
MSSPGGRPTTSVGESDIGFGQLKYINSEYGRTKDNMKEGEDEEYSEDKDVFAFGVPEVEAQLPPVARRRHTYTDGVLPAIVTVVVVRRGLRLSIEWRGWIYGFTCKVYHNSHRQFQFQRIPCFSYPSNFSYSYNPLTISSSTPFHTPSINLSFSSYLSTVSAEEDPPFAEVRAPVSNINDPEMPASTFPDVNVFFDFRSPAPSVVFNALLLLSSPMGKGLSFLLPIRTYRIKVAESVEVHPIFLDLTQPWNIKEHGLVFIMANVAISSTYDAINVIDILQPSLGLLVFCRPCPRYPAHRFWPRGGLQKAFSLVGVELHQTATVKRRKFASAALITFLSKFSTSLNPCAPSDSTPKLPKSQTFQCLLTTLSLQVLVQTPPGLPIDIAGQSPVTATSFTLPSSISCSSSYLDSFSPPCRYSANVVNQLFSGLDRLSVDGPVVGTSTYFWRVRDVLLGVDASVVLYGCEWTFSVALPVYLFDLGTFFIVL